MRAMRAGMIILAVLPVIAGCASSRASAIRSLQKELAAVRRAEGGTQPLLQEPRVGPSGLRGMPRPEVHAALGAPTRCPGVNGYTMDGHARVGDCDRYPLFYLPAGAEGGGMALYLLYTAGQVSDAQYLQEL